MPVHLEVHGLAELEEKLKQLPLAVGKRVLASAGRKAMKPVFEDSVRNCPVSSGVLRASLRLAATAKGSQDTGVVSAGVTVKRQKLLGEIEIAEGFSETVKLDAHADASWRWHFVEFGTSHSPAHPFLRPAFDHNTQRVLDILRDELARNIDKALAKQLPADGG